MRLQVAFFLPQLVQQLRGDDSGAVRQFLFDGAQRSRLFAHHLVSSFRSGVPCMQHGPGKVEVSGRIAVFLLCRLGR